MQNVESVYIHFPYCRHLCNYCDFYKLRRSPTDRNFDLFHAYLNESFVRHHEFLSAQNYRLGALKSVYIGGGTPSMWGEEGANFLQDFFLKNAVKLADDCEFTVEFNPGNWNIKTLDAWRSVGANRFSLGIQSFNDTYLKLLDRVHRVSEVSKTLRAFEKRNINFTVDFMLGLPYSKEHQRNIFAELDEILSFSPKHLSLYILTVKKNYVHFKEIPKDLWISEEYKGVATYLKNKGFEHYEVSNFARPGFFSRHNLAYWNAQSVAAFGPSATGFLAHKGAREGGVRYKWMPQRADFAVEKLGYEELQLEKLYLSLRTFLGISFQDFTNEVPRDKFYSLALQWEQRGYVDFLSEEKVILSSEGKIMLDSLMDEIFILGGVPR